MSRFSEAFEARMQLQDATAESWGWSNLLGWGEWLVEQAIAVVHELGPDAVPKDQFLAEIDKLYSDYIAKIDLPGPFDAVLHAQLKAMVLKIAGDLYDNFFKKGA